MYKELTLQPSYYTNHDDIAEKFYIPVLSKSIKYDRVSGYFSSKALASYAQGIAGLIQHNGKMRLIISVEISEEDFNLIKLGYECREGLKEELLDKLSENLSESEMMNYCNLAHLIANEIVDIKIGFTKNGIFHSKFGICSDFSGEIIYFNGSNNETEAAINKNFESFDITTTWLSSEFDSQKIYSAIKEFKNLWNNTSKDEIVYVLDFNEAVKNKILKFDRGKIILDEETLADNAIVLTIDDGKLVLYDNLRDQEIRPFFIRSKLLPYLNPDYPYFNNKLSYIEIKQVINEFEKEAEKRRFNLVISQKLKEFIDKSAYWIEERSKYGTLIKYQDNLVQAKFDKFNEIVSKELYRTLREKQLWSAFFMHEMKNAANFSVPGAGKTSMVYGVFAYLNSETINMVDRIVMIGPKNSFQSWKLEFVENFKNKKPLKVLDIHENVSSEFQFRLESGSKNLILVNYESLQRYEAALSDIIDSRTMLIFDEVHKIKGLTSIRAHVAKRISNNAGFKYVLTGTPIPNSFTDIYNLLNILYSDEYKLFFNFKVSDLKSPNSSMIETINNKLYPFFWRTTKDELGVPKANPDQIIKVPALYVEQQIIDLLYRKYGHSPFLLYIRLIQASTNPHLLLKSIDFVDVFGDDDSMNTLIPEDAIVFTEEELSIIYDVPVTSKFKEAIDLATDLYSEGKQSIIWCIFVSTIEKVQNSLIKKGIRAEVIYGSTPQQERDRIIQLFKEDKIDVLITNPHTLAESVSLHKTCHDAIYLEYSFNLTHMLQSRDRIHRLGLPNNQYTQYHYLMLEGEYNRNNTIDEKVYIRLKEKEQRMLESIERGVLEPDPNENYDEIISLFN